MELPQGGRVRFGSYAFSCIFLEKALLPPFKGSTLRGAFGTALKCTACSESNSLCRVCASFDKCIYAATFEASGSASSKNPHGVLPHPYAFRLSRDERTEYRQGDRLDFSLLLFGRFNDYFPMFLCAVATMGENGLGKGLREGMGRFGIDRVVASGQDIYDPRLGRLVRLVEPDVLRLGAPSAEARGDLSVELLTPLRLKHENRYPDGLPFHVLVRAMLRRVSSLCATFGDGEPLLDYAGVVRKAGDIATVSSSVSWQDLRRYSNRQGKPVILGGLVGQIVYRGDFGEFLPLLDFCRLTQLGKQTVFGLGMLNYSLDAA